MNDLAKTSLDLRYLPAKPYIPTPAVPPPSPEFGLHQLLELIARRFRLALLTFVLVAGGVFAFLMERPAVYTASTWLSISPRQDRVVADSQALSRTDVGTSVVDTEIELLKSPALVGKLVEKERLYETPIWNPLLRDKSGSETAFPMEKSDHSRSIHVEHFDARDLQETLASVRDAITVRRRGLSYLLEVEVMAPTPDAAANVANAFVATYLEWTGAAQLNSANEASLWLGDRLTELKAEAERKQAAVQEYKTLHNLLSAEGANVTERQVVGLQTALLTARTELSDKESRYSQLNTAIASGKSPDSIGLALQSDVIRELRARQADIARRQADVENRYGLRHPTVASTRQERADIDNLIHDELLRIAANLKEEAALANVRVQSLETELSKLTGQLNDDNAAMTGLRQLEASANAAQAVLERYQERHLEIAQQGVLSAVQTRIASPAVAPIEKSSPKPSIAALIALAAGLLGASMMLLAAEMIGFRPRARIEALRAIPLPTLWVIPKVRPSDHKRHGQASRSLSMFLIKNPRSAFAEAFRMLKVAISHYGMGTQNSVIAITSVAGGEGKTTVAIGLAQVCAMAGQRVLVVDCDLRKKSLTVAFKIAASAGVGEVLSGKTSWREAIVAGRRFYDVEILPVAEGANLVDVFTPDRMKKLLREVAGHYDLVVLDCPPVLTLAETSVIAGAADDVLLVCRPDKVRKSAIQEAISQLSVARAHLTGIVINAPENLDAIKSTMFSSRGYFEPSVRQ